MKAFKVLKTLAVVLLLAVPFTACDEEDNPVTTDPDVAAPTNLKAASGDGTIFLSWTPSIDETADNFGGYDITVLNKSTNDTDTKFAGKGVNYITISQLSSGRMINGVRYQFTIRSVTELGKTSSDFATVEWSPAFRQNTDAMGLPIKVYATTSTQFNSAIDLYNANGNAEVIPQIGQTFQDRGDLYVYAAGTSGSLSLVSPAEANNQGLQTQFSNATPVNADNLDDQLASEPPADGTYTLKQIDIADAGVSTGRVYWGRLVRGSDHFYFRLLIKKGSNGKLIQGSGNDRYI
ncbi:MAG: fibronectin type III domain-containing protein, partial [Bacteroidetes bacterium]|nr:fibronectin type III domain-containing protein [Bacteroidota bacterium]